MLKRISTYMVSSKIQSNQIQSNQIQSNPIESNPIQSNQVAFLPLPKPVVVHNSENFNSEKYFLT